MMTNLGGVGYPLRVVTAGHIDELRAQIEDHRRQGRLDGPFYDTELTSFRFTPPSGLPGAASLVIVAVPRPAHRVLFQHAGRHVPVLIPPTYAGYAETQREVEEVLSRLLSPLGKAVVPAALPEKLLAACSGLACYGRNNITYVEGVGSYHQLVAFHCDLVCDEEVWQEPRMLGDCEGCLACARRCPTGAIPRSRFLLRGERCITHYSEHEGEFPKWLRPSWHSCLIGCLECQTVCPANAGVTGRTEDAGAFSEAETALILEGGPPERYPAETAAKLERLGMSSYLSVLPRNLAAALGRSGT